MLFNLRLQKIDNNETLYSTINYIMPHYYNDPFYHETFMELFPDYEKMSKFSEFAKKISNSYHTKIQGLNKNNLFETLAKGIGNSLFNKTNSIKTSFNTLHEGLSILYDFDKDNPNIPDDTLKEIEQLYPNFGLLTRLLNDPDFSSKIDDSSFKDKSGYSDFSTEIINLAYKEKLSEIENIKSELRSLSLEQTEIETQEKTDQAFKDLYPQKEKYDEEIRTYEQELQEIQAQIGELNTEIDEHSLIVNPESNNIFQKLRNLFNSFINRGKIKNSEKLIESNSEQIEKLSETQKEYTQRIEKAKRKSLQTEIDFKQASGKEITLDQYHKLQIENTENQDKTQNNTERKNAIQERMQSLATLLSIKKSELKELIDTGLVKDEVLKTPIHTEKTEVETDEYDSHSGH